LHLAFILRSAPDGALTVVPAGHTFVAARMMNTTYNDGTQAMKFVIKGTGEEGFNFPADPDYAEYFPQGLALSAAQQPAAVQATFPWGVGTFTFGEFVINAVFKYKSIDFGYTEPLIEEMAQIVAPRTGQPTKWYQVPVRKVMEG
jgi:hypothetical protein